MSDEQSLCLGGGVYDVDKNITATFAINLKHSEFPTSGVRFTEACKRAKVEWLHLYDHGAPGVPECTVDECTGECDNGPAQWSVKPKWDCIFCQ